MFLARAAARPPRPTLAEGQRLAEPDHQRTKVMGRLALKVVRSFLLTSGILRMTGYFKLESCISVTWSRLHCEAAKVAVLMIWMVPGCARWRPAISEYIWLTAPLIVTSRYSLYMLWVSVRLW